MIADRSDYSEDALIEQPAMALFGELGWETADCFHEFEQVGGSPLGRETAAEVVLVPRLRRALERLNPKAPAEAIIQAIEEITRDRSRMSPAAANQEVYRLLKEGVKVRALSGGSDKGRGRAGDRERGGSAEGSRGAGGRGRRGERENKGKAKSETRRSGSLIGICRAITTSSSPRSSG